MEEQKIPVPVAAPVAAPIVKPKISFDDFAKVEIRAGKILSAEKVENADKLLKLSVDFAEETPRQIVSGIAMHFSDPSTLVGCTAMFVTNLEPRTIRGYESNGMLFAISTPPVPATETTPEIPGTFSLLQPNSSIPPGTRAH